MDENTNCIKTEWKAKFNILGSSDKSTPYVIVFFILSVDKIKRKSVVRRVLILDHLSYMLLLLHYKFKITTQLKIEQVNSQVFFAEDILLTFCIKFLNMYGL